MNSFKKLKKPIKGTFLDDAQNPLFEEADACMLGIAFDATASFAKGAWFGPHAIMTASHQIEFEAPVFGVSLSEKIKIYPLGVLEYPRRIKSTQSQEWRKKETEKISNEMVFDVKQIAQKVLKNHKLLMSFGGEHSVCNGVFQAMAKEFDAKKITIIQLDAHLDLREALEGLHYSHGSIMKRATDLGFPIVQIGVRDQISQEEQKVIETKNLIDKIFPCATMPVAYYKNGSCLFCNKNFLWNGLFTAKAINRIFHQIKTPFAYLSIDVDAFDPVFFPGTGTPLPFGLDFASAQNFLYGLLLHLKQQKIKLLGFDIVEVAPQLKANCQKYSADQTSSTQTEMNAALLAYKLLLWRFLDKFKKR